MKREVFGKCPVCSGNLEAIRLQCTSCNTQVEGNFSLCRFCMLNEEEKHFIEVFIKNRGSIKEVEKELKISYPTVKNRLENVIRSLGLDDKEESHQTKKEILEQLKAGAISVEEALKLMKSAK